MLNPTNISNQNFPTPLLPDQQLLELCAKEALHKTKKQQILHKNQQLYNLLGNLSKS